MLIQKPADLARAVKTRRQAQGLTQQDIADAVGITRQSLARIERGHAGASFDTVLRILDRLGVDLAASWGTTATREADAPTQPPRWPASPSELNGQIPKSAAGDEPVPTDLDARWALVNAMIEAGDPDRANPSTTGVRSSENSSGAVDG